MRPTQHKSNNTVLAPPPGSTAEECAPLAITRVVYGDGTVSVRSYWQLSEEELKRILETKMVCIEIFGRTHAPINLYVEGMEP